MNRVLIDTGPLVALLDGGDRDHGLCVRAAKRLPAALMTTWPVLTEAVYLLAEAPKAQDALLEKVEEGSVRVAPLDIGDARGIRLLMRKYRDLPMDFAAASLVWIASREGVERIFTLDRRDFSVYRAARGRPFAIVP